MKRTVFRNLFVAMGAQLPLIMYQEFGAYSWYKMTIADRSFGVFAFGLSTFDFVESFPYMVIFSVVGFASVWLIDSSRVYLWVLGIGLAAALLLRLPRWFGCSSFFCYSAPCVFGMVGFAVARFFVTGGWQRCHDYLFSRPRINAKDV
jgi:hypothetical protein